MSDDNDLKVGDTVMAFTATAFPTSELPKQPTHYPQKRAVTVYSFEIVVLSRLRSGLSTHLCSLSFEGQASILRPVKAAKLRNDYGDPVEEFEIQFIDGEAIDCDLAKAIGINRANLKQYYDAVEQWDDHEKTSVILAVGKGGYIFEDNTQSSDFDVEVHHIARMRDLAEQFVDDGMFGDIPERLQFYIDYDAIARDLSADYTEADIVRTHLIYRCT